MCTCSSGIVPNGVTQCQWSRSRIQFGCSEVYHACWEVDCVCWEAAWLHWEASYVWWEVHYVLLGCVLCTTQCNAMIGRKCGWRRSSAQCLRQPLTGRVVVRPLSQGPTKWSEPEGQKTVMAETFWGALCVLCLCVMPEWGAETGTGTRTSSTKPHMYSPNRLSTSCAKRAAAGVECSGR